MYFTEEQLITYSKPLSNSEDLKCKNAINVVSTALKSIGYNEKEQVQLAYSDTFAYETRLKKGSTEIKLLVQGSYANNTNVRLESDVDIAVIQEDVFVTNYRSSASDHNYGFSVSEYSFKQYKQDIYDILVERFGQDSVEWKNKCLSIEGNSYRMDTDSVPARRFRDYTNDYSNSEQNFVGGIKIFSDKGEVITNYPEQHIKNGRSKNNTTNRFYKKNVRIIKRLRYIMIEHGMRLSSLPSSFYLESLLWNIPDYKYTSEASYLERFQGILNYLMYISPNELDSYTEVNGIKGLCKNASEKANMLEFIKVLYDFFESD